MSFEVRLHPDVNRFLEKCNLSLKERIVSKLRLLKENPEHYLDHLQGTDYAKLRIGDYRCLIDLDLKRKIVFVRVIDHRRRIYQKIPES
ncbi:MAG: type II toxin-antitoxin system RelE/ParE family toxin [Candidatus Woesearchaeota archaeon]